MLIKIDIKKAQELAKMAIEELGRCGFYYKGERFYKGEEKELAERLLEEPLEGNVYQKRKAEEFERETFGFVRNRIPEICSLCERHEQCRRRRIQGRYEKQCNRTLKKYIQK